MKKIFQIFLFSFSHVVKEEILKEILSLDSSKVSLDTDIPTKILKDNADIFSDFFLSGFNNSITTSIFPSSQQAIIRPVFKKGDKNSKENYRPVSLLPNISKIFEQLLFKQISNFMEPLFSKQQCGFGKGYSTQYCLLSMLKKWKSAVDKGKYFRALLTDLPKAFDCISHELILAKLHAYGFSLRALRLIHSYLTNRKQRTRVHGKYISWEIILFGVPQASILGPLLFNIFRCDLFLIMKETSFASYADDNTPYVTAENLDEVIKSLEKDSIKLFQWFSDNQMKANYNKCHLLVSGKNNVTMNASGFKIKNSECEKLLEIKVDCGLKFENYLSGVNKINALSRVTPFMILSKKKMLMNYFFMSQFSYCPLVGCVIVAQ